MSTGKRLLLTLVLWIGIFVPPLVPFFNVMHLLGALSLIYIFLSGKVAKWFLKTEACLLMFFAFTSLSILLNGKLEASAIILQYMTYWLFDVVPFTYVLSQWCKKHGMTFYDLETNIIQAGSLAAGVSCISLLSTQIHDAFIDMLLNAGYSASYYEAWAFRSHGLSFSLQFSGPIAMAMIALLVLNRFIKEGKILYLLLSFFIAAMGFVNARTSIVIYVVGVLILSLIHNNKILRMIGVCASTFAVVLIVFNVLKHYMAQSGYNRQMYWLYDGLANILSIFSGEVTTYYDSLGYFSQADRWVLPDAFLHLLIGTGERILSTNSFGVYSDIGYINDVWYGGIVYTVAMYLCIAYAIRFVYLYLKKIDKKHGLSIVFISLCGLCIGNLKGYAVNFNEITNLIWLFIAFAACPDTEPSEKVATAIQSDEGKAA